MRLGPVPWNSVPGIRYWCEGTQGTDCVVKLLGVDTVVAGTMHVSLVRWIQPMCAALF